MSDFLQDPQKAYEEVSGKITRLQQLLRMTTDAGNRRNIQSELRKLLGYQESLESMYSITPRETPDSIESDDDGGEWEFLERAQRLYAESEKREDCRDEDLGNLGLYLIMFEEEILAFLNRKKLELDVKYSRLRDNFYDQYLQISRLFEETRLEFEQIHKGFYHNQDDLELAKKKQKLKDRLFIKTNGFFNLLNNFASEIYHDVKNGGFFCTNPEAVLDFSDTGKPNCLNGFSVPDGLAKVSGFASEIMQFLNVPDFS